MPVSYADTLKDPFRRGDLCHVVGHDFGPTGRKRCCEGCGADNPNAQPYCIGCGKFLRRDAGWNQCGDCDTRYPEEMW